MLKLTETQKTEAADEYVKQHFLQDTIWRQETCDAFITGAEFASHYYELQLAVILQKLDGYKTKLAEIIGGIPYGK